MSFFSDIKNHQKSDRYRSVIIAINRDIEYFEINELFKTNSIFKLEERSTDSVHPMDYLFSFLQPLLSLWNYNLHHHFGFNDQIQCQRIEKRVHSSLGLGHCFLFFRDESGNWNLALGRNPCLLTL